MICVLSCLQTPINVPHCHNARKIAQPVYSALQTGFCAVLSFPFPLTALQFITCAVVMYYYYYYYLLLPLSFLCN